jgi:hypothetical protein
MVGLVGREVIEAAVGLMWLGLGEGKHEPWELMGRVSRDPWE